MAPIITTLPVGFIAAGDTVVMPCGAQMEVERWETHAPGIIALFATYGERFLLPTTREVGILGAAAAMRAA